MFLRADKTVPYGDLMALMNELRSAGYLQSRWSASKRTKPSDSRSPEKRKKRGRRARAGAACFGLALLFHAGGAYALLARWHEDSDLVANAPVVMVDLAPVPVAPQTQPTELPPGPQQTEAEPEPEPSKPLTTIEQKPDDSPQPELAVTPPPKPVEKPKKHKPRRKNFASLTSAPSPAEQRAERAAAPRRAPIAQFQRIAELANATGRATRTSQTLSGGSAIARRARRHPHRLQRGSPGRRP